LADLLNRRGILRGLATLPLIGGGVTLIGQPTASAEPLTDDLLHSYQAWLAFEGKLLQAELNIRKPGSGDSIPTENAGGYFHKHDYDSWRTGRHASRRAAIVLSAVGCDWKEHGDV